MPDLGPLVPGGKVGENEWNRLLAGAIATRGFPTAQFEPIIKIRVGGRLLTRKPDVGFTDGGVHIVSGKLGGQREFEAYRSADEYRAVFESLPRFGETFAVTYPATKKERFHLYVIPRRDRESALPFTLETLDAVADRIVEIVQGRIAEAERFLEPAAEATPRLLRSAALELAETIKGVSQLDLENVFGGHDFFSSVLSASLPGVRKKETLHLGAAFLFVNQVLFYVLLSRAAARGGKPDLYPRIEPRHASSPMVLWTHYFSKVRERDYEPIYGLDVSLFFKGHAAETACGGIVSALLGMAPRLEVPDIAGQVFQTLIPLEIRKPLGAHYTNPRAAALLAQLAIDDKDVHVLDPACGSGTLLVASYRRKAQIAGEVSEKLHRRFVEGDITGIDAMAFAGHLAAVNLALQQPLLETDQVRIGTTDSTLLRPGNVVPTTGEALPTEFRQARLDSTFAGGAGRRRKRVVQLGKVAVREFEVKPQDLVIMNPPFTSRENMAPSYRDRLAERFSRGSYGKATSGKKISQQAYFILLADQFLNPGGHVAAVLPLTTLGGRDYWPLVDFLIENYTVRYVVVGLGRTSFSEDTSLSECLLVAEKSKPGPESSFRLVATLKHPDDWTDEDTNAIASASRANESVPDLVSVREFSTGNLSSVGPMLPELMLRVLPEYEEARNAFAEVVRKTKTPLVRFEELRKRGVIYKERIEKARHIEEYGASALFACRNEARALRRMDRLVFDSETEVSVNFRDRVGGARYTFPADEVVPAIRRLSYLNSLDVTTSSDFCVSRPGSALQKAMNSFYGDREAARKISRLRAKGLWEKIVAANSSRLVCAARVNFSAPGTTLLSCWSDSPMFLASPNYMASGFENDREAKLLCLWMNSTVGIFQLLPAASTTEGAWVRLERSTVDRMLLPNPALFSEENWSLVESLWNEVRHLPLSSLVVQLEAADRFRKILDDGLLSLLGLVDEPERNRLSSILRAGVLKAIRTLRKAMGSGIGDENAEQ